MLGPANALIAGMIIAVVDALTGLSGRLAKKVHYPEREDLFLLLLVLAAGFFALGLLIYTPGQITKMSNYVNPEDLEAFLRSARAFTEVTNRTKQFANIIIGVLLVSAAVCFVLAMKKRRPLLLWVPLSLLANAGGIFWILTRKREVR